MCVVLVLFFLGVIAAFWVGLTVIGGLFALLPWLIIGLLAGAVASAVTRSQSSILGDILLGLAGSFIGGAVFALVFHHAVRGFFLEPFFAATIGAIILLIVVKALRGPSYS